VEPELARRAAAVVALLERGTISAVEQLPEAELERLARQPGAALPSVRGVAAAGGRRAAPLAPRARMRAGQAAGRAGARALKAPEDVHAVVTVPALLSVATVARLLECSPRTVRRRIAEGGLPAVIEGDRLMVRGDELRAYVDRLQRPSAATMPRRRPTGRTFTRL
jgi:excisionase family DNA binding protein